MGDEIGRGGMGFVYAGQHRELQNNVAIKIMPKRQFRDVQSIDRFRREARACAALDHPHIVPVYHFGETDTLAYLVMRRVAGRSLTTWKAPSDPHKLSLRLARIGLQAAMALQYSHEKGIIHRDIKPGNLLMEDGHLWLTDFGLAKRLEAGELTRTGQVVGTLRYLAPEMLQNVCGPTSDIYGLGLTLYELASGQPFGDDETSVATTYMLPHLSEKNPAIPEQLSQIIMKACAFRPEDRYQSAAEMIGAATISRWPEESRPAANQCLAKTSLAPQIMDSGGAVLYGTCLPRLVSAESIATDTTYERAADDNRSTDDQFIE